MISALLGKLFCRIVVNGPIMNMLIINKSRIKEKILFQGLAFVNIDLFLGSFKSTII